MTAPTGKQIFTQQYDNYFKISNLITIPEDEPTWPLKSKCLKNVPTWHLDSNGYMVPPTKTHKK